MLLKKAFFKHRSVVSTTVMVDLTAERLAYLYIIIYPCVIYLCINPMPFPDSVLCHLFLWLLLIIWMCMVSDESGLLVHCISGWDRTPLFVSLLRLSLWAVSFVFSSPFSVCFVLSSYSPLVSFHMTGSQLVAYVTLQAFISSGWSNTLQNKVSITVIYYVFAVMQ